MEIASNRVASIHYTLTNDEGQVIDRSPEAQPLSYLHGAGNIVPGLERALEGKSAGDTFNVDVTPEEGYGQRNDGLIQTVPREAFQAVDSINPGMQFRAQTDNGPLVVTVVEVDDAQVKIDGNHPLAGQTLHFAIEVANVREASEQEKQVGHVEMPEAAG